MSTLNQSISNLKTDVNSTSILLPVDKVVFMVSYLHGNNTRILKIKLNMAIVAVIKVAVMTGSPTSCRSHLMHFLHLDVQVDGFALKLWFNQLFWNLHC